MDQQNKHRKLVLDYVRKSNLEIIVQNSIRSLIQTSKLPDNPFGAMTRHFTYFAAKDDLNRLQQKVKSFEIGHLAPAGSFSVTNQEKQLECFGLAHILNYVNVVHFNILSKTLKELCLEEKRNYGPYVLEVRTAIGGSEIFVNNLIPHSEIAPSPLEIRAECIVEGPKFENAFSFFADYVYEDIMRIGSNNALNLVRDFCTEMGPRSSHIKRVSLSEMMENKQLLINELKNATIQKRSSYIRVLVFSSDLQRFTSKDLVRAITPSRLLSAMEPSVLDHFKFISMKKCYVLHYTTSGNPTDFNSLSPVPCLSLYSALFPNPDSARHYAKIFYTEAENPYDIQALEDYLQYRRDRVIKYYKNGKNIKMTWEMLQLVLANKNQTANIEIINEIFTIFAHPNSKLYRIIRMTKALIVLINSFYDTNFEHFKKLSEGLFVRLKEECWSAFGNASSAEMLILKPLVIQMLDSTSVNRSRTLMLTPNTLRILERIEYVCIAVANSTTELLLRNSPSLSEAFTRLFSAFSVNLGMTHAQLSEIKQTELSFDVEQELKSQNLRKDNEFMVIYDYLVKTGVMEVLILTTRDLVMSYPMLPNPLKTYAVKILTALFRYDMFVLDSNEVLEKYLHVPNEIGEGIFVHNNPDNKYSKQDLAYVVAFEEFLLVASWQEIGFFRNILKNYEFNPDLFTSSLVRGYSMQGITSVCGTSLVNSQELMKFPSQWHVYFDLFVTGPSFNAASQSFLDMLIKYALWVDSSTDASVLGFFTPFSETPLASFDDIVSASERKNSIGLIMSTYQMNGRMWLRFLIPYKGDSNSNVVAVPLAINAYFNMHFRVNITKKITSLVPISGLEDIVKVFYSREDFELWKDVIDIKAQTIKEMLINEMNLSFNNGQHYRGCVCLLFLKVVDKDKEDIGKLLRINLTPLKIIIECCRFSEILMNSLSLASQNHRKSSNELLIDWVNKFKKYSEATFFEERNVILENSQIGMLRVVDSLVKSMGNANGAKYQKALASLEIVNKYLKVCKLIGSITIHELLQATKGLSN